MPCSRTRLIEPWRYLIRIKSLFRGWVGFLKSGTSIPFANEVNQLDFISYLKKLFMSNLLKR